MRSDPVYREQMFSLIESWRRSGLARQAFCKEHGISYHRFGYWHKRYQEHKEAAGSTTSGFIALSVAGSTAGVPQWQVPCGPDRGWGSEEDPRRGGEERKAG